MICFLLTSIVLLEFQIAQGQGCMIFIYVILTQYPSEQDIKLMLSLSPKQWHNPKFYSRTFCVHIMHLFHTTQCHIPIYYIRTFCLHSRLSLHSMHSYHTQNVILLYLIQEHCLYTLCTHITQYCKHVTCMRTFCVHIVSSYHTILQTHTQYKNILTPKSAQSDTTSWNQPAFFSSHQF